VRSTLLKFCGTYVRLLTVWLVAKNALMRERSGGDASPVNREMGYESCLICMQFCLGPDYTQSLNAEIKQLEEGAGREARQGTTSPLDE